MDAAQTMDGAHHSGKGLGHSLKKVFNFVAKTVVIGIGLYAAVTLAEFTLLHSGMQEGYIIGDVAKEFFQPIFEATGITGWAEGFDPEPLRSSLKSVHEFFGLENTFLPLDSGLDASDFANDFE